MNIKYAYVSPLCDIIEVKIQNVLCQSGNESMPQQDWGNGGFYQG